MDGTIFLDRKDKIKDYLENKLESISKEKVEDVDNTSDIEKSGLLEEDIDKYKKVEDVPTNEDTLDYKLDKDEVYAITPRYLNHSQEHVSIQSDECKTLNESVTNYLKYLQNQIIENSKDTTDVINVDNLASQIAKVYEKVRRIIDWKEEHIVRRTAIERILKRSLITEISGIKIIEIDPEKLAEPFVYDLVRGGYFENNKVPTNKINEVKDILSKYIYLLKNNPYSIENGALRLKKRVNFYNWLMEIAACEIEESIEKPIFEQSLMKFMTQNIYENLNIEPQGEMLEEEKYIQTYIGVHKALYNLDSPIISYNILKIKYPYFFERVGDYKKLGEDILNIWDDIETTLQHPNRGDFYRITQSHSAAFLLLGDIIKTKKGDIDEIRQALCQPEDLNQNLEYQYNERYKTLKSRLYRSAIYSTLSIFVAGAASLFIFEFPLAKLLYNTWSIWAIVADIMIPTILMFILVMLIKLPSKENYEKVNTVLMRIIYKQLESNTYKIKIHKKRHKILSAIFFFIYTLGGIVSLGFIFWVFKLAKVPWTSLYVDTANVALVVFAAMVIQAKSKEISIEENTNLGEFLVDIFSLPLAKLGQWLSEKWKEWNFISVFFSTLVDTPFSSFIRLIEDWRSFVKGKRSEIH